MLLKNLLVEWESYYYPHLTAKTAHNYDMIVHKRLIPAIGDWSVPDITKKMAQGYVDGALQIYAASTVKDSLKVLKSAVKYYIDAYDKLYVDQFQRLIFPKDRQKVKTFAQQEAEAIISSFRVHWMHDVALMAYMTGMRCGEILALQFDDIDFDQNCLLVHQALSGYDDIVYIKETKTGNERIVYFGSRVRQMLLRRRKKAPGPFVFSRPDGQLINPRCVRDNMSSACKRLGIKQKGRGIHAIRHTHATLALDAGANIKVVSERLGHSSVSITLDTYYHPEYSQQTSIVDMFDPA